MHHWHPVFTKNPTLVGPPPLTPRRESKIIPSLYSVNILDRMIALRTSSGKSHAILEKIFTSNRQKGLRMHNLHPFFSKIYLEPPRTAGG